jgi:hypothetical protein
MIPKGGTRYSEKIMLNQKARERRYSGKPRQASALLEEGMVACAAGAILLRIIVGSFRAQ